MSCKLRKKFGSPIQYRAYDVPHIFARCLDSAKTISIISKDLFFMYA